MITIPIANPRESNTHIEKPDKLQPYQIVNQPFELPLQNNPVFPVGQNVSIFNTDNFGGEAKYVTNDSNNMKIIPDLGNCNFQNPLITTKVRRLINNYWAIVLSKAMQSSFPLENANLTVFTDSIEDRQQVVIQINTSASAAQALSFWEGLNSEVEDWTNKLDNHNRTIFIRDITLRINWK